MKAMFEKLLGPNWETTVWGTVTAVCGAVAAQPELLDFLPPDTKEKVHGVATFIAVVSGTAFAAKVKSANVTGGNVAATKEAEKRVDGK
jgi:hypothetical protein